MNCYKCGKELEYKLETPSEETYICEDCNLIINVTDNPTRILTVEELAGLCFNIIAENLETGKNLNNQVERVAKELLKIVSRRRLG